MKRREDKVEIILHHLTRHYHFMSAYQSSGRTVQIIVNADISAPPCVYVNPFKLAERPVENINIKTIGNLKGVSGFMLLDQPFGFS